MNRVRVGILFTLLCLLLGFQAQAKKTLVYCAESSARKLNPQQVNDAGSIISVGYTMYDQLVSIDSDSLKVEPHLAKGWQVSKDGKTYTFELREDVKFHSNKRFKPSRTLNADDVVFSFERQRDKNHPYYNVGGGNYFLFNGLKLNRMIKSVKKLGSHKVQFVLTEKNAGFIRYLGMFWAGIQSKEYADQLVKVSKKDLIDKEPIGTGPFRFKTFKKDRLLRLTRFDDYFMGKTPVDQLVYSVTPDSSVRYQKIRNKSCHISINPPANAVEKIKKSKDLEVHTIKGFNVSYLALNVEKPPLNNIKVRKAIAHALNRDAYIKTIYLGEAEVANHPIPPALLGAPKNMKGHAYNPELAKKLLKEAGFEKGLKLKMWTLPIVRHYNPNGKRMGEMMQADLKKVGIDIELVTYEWGTYLDKSEKGEHEILQIGWASGSGDPDEFMDILFSCNAVKTGGNLSRHCSKDLDKLILMAKRELDPKKRVELYRKAQMLVRDNVMWVPIAHGNEHRVIRKEVKNYKAHSTKGEYLYGVDL